MFFSDALVEARDLIDQKSARDGVMLIAEKFGELVCDAGMSDQAARIERANFCTTAEASAFLAALEQRVSVRHF